MNFVNLTQHDITFYDQDGKIILNVKPSGDVCRIKEEFSLSSQTVAGIPVVNSFMDKVIGLPEPKKGVTYLVSMAVALVLPERQDVFCPDTSAYVVRDAAGKIIGTQALKRFPQI